MSVTAQQLDVSRTTSEQKIEILKYASDTRKFEIGLYWTRSVAFWGFVAAAFVAYGISIKDTTDKDIPFAIGCFGLISSLAWTLVNRGNKYWRDAWDQKVKAVENDVLGCNLFSNIEPTKGDGWWGAKHYSLATVPIALSDFTVAIWFALVIKSSELFLVIPVFDEHLFFRILLLLLTILYAYALLTRGLSRRPSR